MKRGSILFARGVVYLVGLSALAICFILLPELVREEAVEKPINPYVTFAFFATAYIIAAPFFVALQQTLRLLDLIDHNKAFSQASLRVLQNIKICALVFAALVVVSVVGWMSFARSIDPTEDITFMVSFGFVFTFVPGVIAVFVAVLQKLLADAVTLKSENDLIV